MIPSIDRRKMIRNRIKKDSLKTGIPVIMRRKKNLSLKNRSLVIRRDEEKRNNAMSRKTNPAARRILFHSLPACPDHFIMGIPQTAGRPLADRTGADCLRLCRRKPYFAGTSAACLSACAAAAGGGDRENDPAPLLPYLFAALPLIINLMIASQFSINGFGVSGVVSAQRGFKNQDAKDSSPGCFLIVFEVFPVRKNRYGFP